MNAEVGMDIWFLFGELVFPTSGYMYCKYRGPELLSDECTLKLQLDHLYVDSHRKPNGNGY